MGEQDEERLQPPSAQQVARRAMVLASFSCRAFIEKGARDAEAETLRQRIIDWLGSIGCDKDIEPLENDLFAAPLGALAQVRVNAATWVTEGLAVRRTGLPKHDQQADPYLVTDSLAFLHPQAADLIATAELRDAEELRAYRELQYAIHCRLRDYLRHRQPKNFTTWVERNWLDSLTLDRATLIVDADLAIGGKAIINVAEDQVRACEWGVREQHRAIIWLVGEYPLFSETPADT